MNQSQSDGMYSPLSISKELWPWCVWTVCLLTISWTSVIAWVEVGSGRHPGILETSIEVVDRASDAVPLIMVYSVFIVLTGNFVFGGGIMVVARAVEAYLNERLERRRER